MPVINPFSTHTDTRFLRPSQRVDHLSVIEADQCDPFRRFADNNITRFIDFSRPKSKTTLEFASHLMPFLSFKTQTLDQLNITYILVSVKLTSSVNFTHTPPPTISSIFPRLGIVIQQSPLPIIHCIDNNF